MRIKEILNDKGLSVNDLAEKMGVSNVALYRQINGKLLVETAERIAAALEVPLWQLFVSPEDISPTPSAAILCPYCQKPIAIHLHALKADLETNDD